MREEGVVAAVCCRGAGCASCGVSPGNITPSRKPLRQGDSRALQLQTKAEVLNYMYHPVGRT